MCFFINIPYKKIWNVNIAHEGVAFHNVTIIP